MQLLHNVISANETVLTRKVIHYLKERGYVQYASTLMEAWRRSITGTSNTILALLNESVDIPELGPHADYAGSKVFSFTMAEAQLHRNRGTSCSLFLGAFKYYRQAYLDLIRESGFDRSYEDYCVAFVNRCFDQMELGFTTEWLHQKEEDLIEELQLMNRAMTNEKNKYLTIFESCSVPMVMLDNNCKSDNLNFEAAQLLKDAIIPGSGYYGGEFHKTCFSFFNSELLVFINHNLNEYKFETDLQTTKGIRHFQVMFTRMLDVTDKFEGIIVTLHDITERRLMEKEMERIGRLELIGQMAAGIGHEIRNPMTTVKGFLQMLSLREHHLSHRETFQLMIDELDRCNSIITEYLSLAKNKRVNLESRDLNSIIEALLPLLSSEANNREITIVFCKENIPHLLLDEKEIRQLIINLVNNGLQAMTFKGILKISTFTNESQVVLSVEDQGTGIPAEIQDKIGTPFFTTKDDGVGLGLAICNSIAARHRASLDFSTGEQGTTFFVKFRNEAYRDQLGLADF